MNAMLDLIDHCPAVLSLEQQYAVSGGWEVFPDTPGTQPIYVKIGDRWVPLGSEPFYPVDLDGKHTPR